MILPKPPPLAVTGYWLNHIPDATVTTSKEHFRVRNTIMQGS